MAERTIDGRGPDWGKGRAKQEFDRLREQANHIPKGQRVARELEEFAGERIRAFFREAEEARKARR